MVVRDVTPVPRLRAFDVVLVLAFNALPVWGVLSGEWSIGALMLLFWIENLFAGLGVALRMLLLPGPRVLHGMKFVMLPFFTVHYGLFVLVHGVFVHVMFVRGGPSPYDQPGFHWAVAAALAVQGWQAWQAHRAYRPPHWTDEERAQAHVDPAMARKQVLPLMQLMAEPYLRIGILHVVIIVGGMLALALGTPMASLLLLVALKTTYELAQASGAVARWRSKMH